MLEKNLKKYRDLTIMLLETNFDNNPDDFERIVSERDEVLTLIEKSGEKPTSEELVNEIIALDEKLIKKTKDKMNEISEKIKKVKDEKASQNKNLNIMNKYSSNNNYQESIYFDKKSE